MAMWLVPLWLSVFALWGLYRPKNLGAGSLEYQSVVTASAITAGTAAAVLYLTKSQVARGFFVLEFAVGILLLLLGRFLVRRLLQQARANGRLLTRVVLSGDVSHIEEIATVINRERWLGYHIVGAVTPPDEGRALTPSGIQVIGHTDALGAAVKTIDAEAVICTEGSFDRSRDFRRLAWELENESTQMIVVPAMTDVAAERLQVRPIAGLPLVHVEQPQSQAASRGGKRLFDLLGSAALLLVSAPVMLAVALAIKLDDGGPVFFRQVRVGRHGEPIEMLKFRSMVVDAEQRLAELRQRNESDGVLFKMAEDPRITRVGHFIRRTSLDEFPQFINVLRGEMSLVGPRPALPDDPRTEGPLMPPTVSRRAVATGLVWAVPAVVATSALPSYAASMGCLGVSFSSTATDCPDIGNNGNTPGSTLSFRVTNGCGASVETTSDLVLTLTVSAAPGSQSELNSTHFAAPTAVVGTISATASPATWTWTIPSGTILAAEASLTGSMVFGNHQPRYVLTMDVTSGTEYFGAASYSTSSGYTLATNVTCTLI